MGNHKKANACFVRDRLQLLLLIGLPILLIIILSISLSGFIRDKKMEIETNVALIEHSNEDKQIEQFIDELKQSDLPQEVIESMVATVKNFAPIHMMKDDVFAELNNMFQITEIDPSEKEAALKEDYAVIIEVPENFTYDLLRNVMLDEGDIGTITLYEKHEIGSAAVKSVVQSFEEQLSMNALLARSEER